MAVTSVNINQNTTYANSVYLDANLLCYARNRLSPNYRLAVSILGSLVVQRVNIFISNLVIDEMWWASLRAFHRNHTGLLLKPRQFKSNPSILNPYKNLIYRITEKVLRLPQVHVLPVHKTSVNVIQVANRLFKAENLMPRDCFHLAFIVANNIRGLITSDSDFDNLNLNQYNLTVFKY